MSTVHRKMDCTLKHLFVMEEVGVVVRKPNPADGRRPLYALSPDVVIRKTEEGAYIDFGFCKIGL